MEARAAMSCAFVKYGRGVMTLTDTQHQILDAVELVIVREGLGGASMRQFAEEADVSLGLLSYHFDGKESLLVAAFTRAATRLFNASKQSAAEVSSPEDKVVAFVRGSFSDDFLDSDHLQLRISLWSVAMTDDEVAALDAHYFERYSRELSALIATARPELRADEHRRRAVDVVSLANGLWLNWARYQNPDDLERGLVLCEKLALG